MNKKPPPKIKPGDELDVAYFNKLRDLIVSGQILSLSPPLSGKPTPDGWIIGMTGAPTFGAAWAGVVAVGGISARVGAVAGHGNVLLYLLNSSGTYISTGKTVEVFSISSTAGGLPSGTWVEVEQDINGRWQLISEDCTS